MQNQNGKPKFEFTQDEKARMLSSTLMSGEEIYLGVIKEAEAILSERPQAGDLEKMRADFKFTKEDKARISEAFLGREYGTSGHADRMDDALREAEAILSDRRATIAQPSPWNPIPGPSPMSAPDKSNLRLMLVMQANGVVGHFQANSIGHPDHVAWAEIPDCPYTMEDRREAEARAAFDDALAGVKTNLGENPPEREFEIFMAGRNSAK